MAFAVIKTGGKQYRVQKGDVIQIDTPSGDKKVGDTVTFDDVLLFNDGKKTALGDPTLKGKKVVGELVEDGRDKKISVVRFRAKSRHFKRKGHRQPFIKVLIKDIGGRGQGTDKSKKSRLKADQPRGEKSKKEKEKSKGKKEKATKAKKTTAKKKSH